MKTLRQLLPLFVCLLVGVGFAKAQDTTFKTITRPTFYNDTLFFERKMLTPYNDSTCRQYYAVIVDQRPDSPLREKMGNPDIRVRYDSFYDDLLVEKYPRGLKKHNIYGMAGSWLKVDIKDGERYLKYTPEYCFDTRLVISDTIVYSRDMEGFYPMITTSSKEVEPGHIVIKAKMLRDYDNWNGKSTYHIYVIQRNPTLTVWIRSNNGGYYTKWLMAPSTETYQYGIIQTIYPDKIDYYDDFDNVDYDSLIQKCGYRLPKRMRTKPQ